MSGAAAAKRKTRAIFVGGLQIGGGARVSVQSMTNTRTADADATVSQILALEAAGCELARVAVPDADSARAIAAIRARIHVPLVADIHFDANLALAAIEAGADKIRINPGNIGSAARVRAVADACRERGVPIRVGVNGGSLERALLAKYGGATPDALVESALGHVRLLEDARFEDICISVKSSDAVTTVAAYRLLSARADYPLHLGVTEAGTEFAGVIRSAAALGALLADGIGDTLRVSLTAEPPREVEAGLELLRALGLRAGPRLVSCPTCGRCQYDMFPIAREVERRLRAFAAPDAPITVAVMGCAVNGPGEAREADFGIAGGNGEGVLFRAGSVVGKAPEAELVDALFRLIEGA
ncbi:MAG: flavodoxin-dependent (E)-4-hydroxy-3-methylbut-2-enyl-diphosphate synthase [Oscillospiraceae bacterium]|jgi:(E)-4-hydroxy-3-methylbut-2-enyl-diphosphate synthase|nr:flavodoxin-dependent (E)-4-hydroxy-3-methylbut-2-enyl-diphosphate synthase [Oscillospiraceae bacterium]